MLCLSVIPWFMPSGYKSVFYYTMNFYVYKVIFVKFRRNYSDAEKPTIFEIKSRIPVVKCGRMRNGSERFLFETSKNATFIWSEL